MTEQDKLDVAFTVHWTSPNGLLSVDPVANEADLAELLRGFNRDGVTYDVIDRHTGQDVTQNFHF